MSLDVLHVSLFSEDNGSITRVAKNIVRNIPQLNQQMISISEHTSEEIRNYINTVQPKILHLHMNSGRPFCDFLFDLKHKPILIQTVHGSYPSQYHNMMDRLVCIHKEGLNLNPGPKSLIIENTVDVSDYSAHIPNTGPPCLAVRFAPEKINVNILEALGKVKGEVVIYGNGFIPSLVSNYISMAQAYAEQLELFARGRKNLIIKPWNPCLEGQFNHHGFLIHYSPKNSTDLSHSLDVMEAVSLGMPVVCRPRSQDYQTYIKHGHNGFIVNTEAELIKACNMLISDFDLRLHFWRNRMPIVNSMPQRYYELYQEYI